MVKLDLQPLICLESRLVRSLTEQYNHLHYQVVFQLKSVALAHVEASLHLPS